MSIIFNKLLSKVKKKKKSTLKIKMDSCAWVKLQLEKQSAVLTLLSQELESWFSGIDCGTRCPPPSAVATPWELLDSASYLRNVLCSPGVTRI